MLTTDSHVYFVGGYLSNWYGCRFTMAPFIGMEPLEFNNSEQAFMLFKALHFGDFNAADRIMKSFIPAEQKRIGRTIRGFDDTRWRAVARDYMLRATRAKFEQNPDLRQKLIDTGDRIIVEAAHYANVWGVGLRESDPKILKEANWKGTNWLGLNHMALRTDFRRSSESVIDHESITVLLAENDLAVLEQDDSIV